MLLRTASPRTPPITLPTIVPILLGNGVEGSEDESGDTEGRDEASDDDNEVEDWFEDRCLSSGVALDPVDLVVIIDALYRGMIFLKIFSRELSLKPPAGESVVAFPNALDYYFRFKFNPAHGEHHQLTFPQ